MILVLSDNSTSLRIREFVCVCARARVCVCVCVENIEFPDSGPCNSDWDKTFKLKTKQHIYVSQCALCRIVSDESLNCGASVGKQLCTAKGTE
jgi:hypothetical protein